MQLVCAVSVEARARGIEMVVRMQIAHSSGHALSGGLLSDRVLVRDLKGSKLARVVAVPMATTDWVRWRMVSI